MVEGGKILSRVVKDLRKYFAVGVPTIEIDTQAQKLIKLYGADLSFNKVPGYHWATCISINEVVVHGVPNDYRLRTGDVAKLDIGVYYNGYHVDYGDTLIIGKPLLPEVPKFLDVGRSTLNTIVSLAKKGQYIGKISQTIEEMIEGAGYRIIEDLTGHAVGKELHEEPLIPGFLDRPVNKTPQMIEGNAYALEVIYSFKDQEVVEANDDQWSLRTKNFSLSGCFENSVFIDGDRTIVLVN